MMKLMVWNRWVGGGTLGWLGASREMEGRSLQPDGGQQAASHARCSPGCSRCLAPGEDVNLSGARVQLRDLHNLLLYSSSKTLVQEV